MNKALVVRLQHLYDALDTRQGLEAVNWADLEAVLMGKSEKDLVNARACVEQGEHGAARHHVRQILGRIRGPQGRPR